MAGNTETAATGAAEEISREDVQHALEVLDDLWGDVYTTGYDPGTGRWWAARKGRIGALLVAGDPAELGRLMAADHGSAQ